MKVLLYSRKSFFRLLLALIFAVCLYSVFAIDSDSDGMSDVYEAVFNLNSADAEDAAKHYDSDTLSNLQESTLWTDPFSSDTDMDGFVDGADNNALSRAVIMWGRPEFTDAEQYSYTGPSWWIGATKQGGEWVNDQCWSVAESNTASCLDITIDRAVLTNNLTITISFDDTLNSDMRLGLYSTNGDVVADDLFGDITDGTGERVTKSLLLPTASFQNASIIRMTVPESGGPCSIYSTVLFIDEDQDGLDADQELQLGLSDHNPDSDSDGISDGSEVLEHKSNPLSTDSDQDGLTDLLEVQQGTSPILSDTDNDGLQDAIEPEHGTDPVKADSDNDGLSDSEELNASYFLIHRLLTWDEAKAHAEELGGHLVVVTSEEEHIQIMNAVGPGVAENTYRPWIGLTDLGHEGQWAWVTGEPFAYARWRVGEPSNGSKQEHYVQYYGGDVWNDNRIQTKAPYILEKSGALDPLNPDCDGDGLPDGVEIALGSSPLLADTDNDGYTDSEEVALGISPIAADSDNDGLSDREELGSVYALVRTDLSWLESKADAEKRGGHMLTLADESEFAKIVDLFGEDELNSRKPWIGLSDHEQEGSWRWVTGEECAFFSWRNGEPNNLGSKEHFVQFYEGVTWNDNGTTARYPYILEIDAGLDPMNRDCDNDGLLDGDEIKWGTSPFNVDTDGDGLSDYTEVGIRGSVRPADDQDADGLSDADEQVLGTDPNNADTDNDGLTDFRELHSFYFLIREKMSWMEAKENAELRGAHLATITSASEHYNILSMIYHHDIANQRPWIGATDQEQEGVWKWVTGEPFVFELWNKKEPNNLGGSENYAQYYGGPYWNDSSDERGEYPYILEIDGTDPLNPDCDGDGFLDGEEVVIGANPLSNDSDADGLTEQEEAALGTNPVMVDSDRDGVSDFAEVRTLGTDPLNWDTDADGLPDGDEITLTQTSPVNPDTDGDEILDLEQKFSVNGVDAYDYNNGHISSQWSISGSGLQLSLIPFYISRSSATYEVVADEGGMYRLVIHSSWEGAMPEQEKCAQMRLYIDGFFVDTVDVLPHGDGTGSYAIYTPWLSTGKHLVKCNPISVNKEITSGLIIDRVGLYAVDGADADGNGMQDWMENELEESLDTDGDGLSDLDEISLYGTSPTDADSDDDGLMDREELEHGTDMLNADSDNDGVSDGVEVNETMTNPLVEEFDGTVSVALTIAGSATNNVAGEWMAEGTQLLSKGRRGFAEYVVNFPEQDLYALNISAAHKWTKSSCTPMTPVDTSGFLVYVDGVYVGKYPMVGADDVQVDVRAFLPVMTPGEHTVRIFWENVRSRLAIRINELQLQTLGGPDANENGIKDWVETSIACMAGVDKMKKSFVSPACIEGCSRYVPFMELTADVGGVVPAKQSAGPRWYANLPLRETGKTKVVARFQNGALEVPFKVKWASYNIAKHADETLVIRAGDAVKFSARAADEERDAFDVVIKLGDDRQKLESVDGAPVIYEFTTAGAYIVKGKYVSNGERITSRIHVQVLSGSFLEENPACMVGQTRRWSFDGMPAGVVCEVDDTVTMALEDVSSLTNGLTQHTVSFHANDTNGEHVMLARLYDGGPIVDSIRLDTFWVQNAVDGYFWVVERFEDSELWEVNSVVKNLPDTGDMQIKVVAGGVTLDDYALERWITNSAYSDIGEYNFRLFHPSDVASSTCHSFKVYQDGQFVGEAFGGVDNDIGEK